MNYFIWKSILRSSSLWNVKQFFVLVRLNLCKTLKMENVSKRNDSGYRFQCSWLNSVWFSLNMDINKKQFYSNLQAWDFFDVVPFCLRNINPVFPIDIFWWTWFQSIRLCLILSERNVKHMELKYERTR
jgi:hypothetical protein